MGKKFSILSPYLLACCQPPAALPVLFCSSEAIPETAKKEIVNLVKVGLTYKERVIIFSINLGKGSQQLPMKDGTNN